MDQAVLWVSTWTNGLRNMASIQCVTVGTQMRNSEWSHMVNEHVISMPDKWEYPWYAAWDLAFHTIALSTVDLDFAKEQLDLMLQEFFLHPTGQIPAYEWNFSDVNPPVHAWATIFLYRTEQALKGKGDLEFLKRSFSKLMLNFSWWVNRKDRFGNNLFEGGFLGLDNIGVFDRSAPLPTGGHLEQADGTAWVSLFCQNMLEISMELAAHDPYFEDMAIKFADHLLWIAHAMNQTGPRWDVGRRRWILLRRPAPSRRQCDAAQGPFHGGLVTPLRHHCHRALAARTGSANGGGFEGTLATHARLA